MTNYQVAQAWANGEVAHTANMSTDGTTLYSYSTPIAWHVNRSRDAISKRFFSMSTRKHQLYATRCARKFVDYKY